MKAITTAALAFITLGILAAEIPKAPVPPSPYLPIIYKFADAMLDHGRDTYGAQKTGLFLSALDRATPGPITNYLALVGVLEQHRVVVKGGGLAGANPEHDQNFLRLLYTLSELSGKPKYREAADAELRWFLTNSQANAFLPEHQLISWETLKDEPLNSGRPIPHEIFRPWMLWERCFELVPDATQRFAFHLAQRFELELAQTEIPDDKRMAREERLSPRHAGFYIRTWAVAYARTKNEKLLRAIELSLDHFEKKHHPDNVVGFRNYLVADAMLSLAVDCDAATRLVPERLATRLQAFAVFVDGIFCALQHNLEGNDGFIIGVDYATRVRREYRTLPWTPSAWKGHRGFSTAQIGMMCVSRYENTGDIRYRNLIHHAADIYLNSLPEDGVDAWPITFAHAISLQVAAWRSTAQQRYLNRARELADFAVKHFFDQGPLPRASLKSNHYEAITGADTLALGLVELHLNILGITAVRCPPNTIDR